LITGAGSCRGRVRGVEPSGRRTVATFLRSRPRFSAPDVDDDDDDDDGVLVDDWLCFSSDLGSML
jgi:hypothetical protein